MINCLIWSHWWLVLFFKIFLKMLSAKESPAIVKNSSTDKDVCTGTHLFPANFSLYHSRTVFLQCHSNWDNSFNMKSVKLARSYKPRFCLTNRSKMFTQARMWVNERQRYSISSILKSNYLIVLAVVVAQLVERSLATPEVRSSNPVFRNI